MSSIYHKTERRLHTQSSILLEKIISEDQIDYCLQTSLFLMYCIRISVTIHTAKKDFLGVGE